MEKPDLSLVSIEELLKEIECRCPSFIACYKMSCADEKGREIKTFFGKGSWMDAVALGSILNNDVMNNWNGELNYLQDLNMEDR